MALPKISFKKEQGGLGRTLPGEDYISGVIFYDTIPTAFQTNNIQKFLSIVDAENLGITNTYSDETKATSTLTVSIIGAANDTLTLAIGTTTLCNYTSVGSLTTTTEATAIAASINSLSYSHNYTATSSGATIIITTPSGYGVAANSLTITKTIVGTLALTGTLVFAGGVGSKLAFYHYQISEFFREQPSGVLYTMFSSATTFATDVLNLQNAATGKLRQIGVYQSSITNIITTNIQNLNAAIVATEATYDVSFSALYACNLTSGLTQLPDLSTLSCNKVSVVIGQGLSGQALSIKTAFGKSVPILGTTLGVLALSKVSDDIAWVGNYNLSDGTELETAGFQTGEDVHNVAVNLQEQLNGYRYIFLRKFAGVIGTYFNDSNTSIATSSDYAYIENNRTIDKAIRKIQTNIIPELNSPLLLNKNGTLTNLTIAYFTSLCNNALEQMYRSSEISAYSTTISDSQNVLSTSELDIVVKIVPLGVARDITVTIGFTLSI